MYTIQERPFAVNFHTTLGDLPCLFSGPQSPSFSCPDGAPAVQLVHWLNLLLACLILAPLAAFAAFTSQGKEKAQFRTTHYRRRPKKNAIHVHRALLLWSSSLLRIIFHLHPFFIMPTHNNLNRFTCAGEPALRSKDPEPRLPSLLAQ